jgi:hypothetical protein
VGPDGDLVLEGQDIGSLPQQCFGDSDYEYWVTVRSAERDRLQLHLVAALLAGPVGSAATQAAQGYRLAGTVAVGSDYIAFLEVPEGGQVLVRAGSVVKGVKIVSVSAQSLKIALATGVVELSLEGTGKPAPTVPSVAVKHVSDDNVSHVYVREVVPEQLWRAVGQPAGNSKVAADSGVQRVAAVLDLPPGSRIVRVHGQPVSSADEAMRRLQEAFANPGGGGSVIDVQTPTGPGRVYLTRPKK